MSDIAHGLKAVFLDIDGTLYDDRSVLANRDYREGGARRELENIAIELGWPVIDAPRLFEAARLEFAPPGRQKASLTETVLALGMTLTWWNHVRAEFCYKPEGVLIPHPKMRQTLHALSDHFWLFAASNNPESLQLRVLHQLDLGYLFSPMRVLGPEGLESFKLKRAFYERILILLQLSADDCLMIGDTEHADGVVPSSVGITSIVLDQGPAQLIDILTHLGAGRHANR